MRTSCSVRGIYCSISNIFLQDNCPFTPNNDQKDDDDDSVGNACNNCSDVKNSDQRDLDGDGNGDGCDNDIDGDGKICTLLLDCGNDQ